LALQRRITIRHRLNPCLLAKMIAVQMDATPASGIFTKSSENTIWKLCALGKRGGMLKMATSPNQPPSHSDDDRFFWSWRSDAHLPICPAMIT